MVELVGRGLHGGHEDAGGPCRRLNVGRAAASAAGRRPPSTLFNSEDKPASPRKQLTVIFVDGGGPLSAGTRSCLNIHTSMSADVTEKVHDRNLRLEAIFRTATERSFQSEPP